MQIVVGGCQYKKTLIHKHPAKYKCKFVYQVLVFYSHFILQTKVLDWIY